MEEKKVLLEVEKESRLDSWLKEKFSALSRTRIQNLIREGKVKVERKKAKPSLKVKKGDKVLISLPPEEEGKVEPESLPVEIIWEDEWLVVVSKPAGMLTHPTPKTKRGTLVGALLFRVGKLSFPENPERQGIVHRLDRETSGVMVVAKEENTHLALSSQFKRREVKKTYLALTRGSPPHKEGRVETPLGKKFRPAVTLYRVLEKGKGWSLVEVKPLTGRTHQIRIHLSLLGASLLGDKIYGRKREPVRVKRCMLHSKSLGFFHPQRKKWMEFEVSLPPDMEEVLEFLRKKFPEE